jgi:hypothetical protein
MKVSALERKFNFALNKPYFGALWAFLRVARAQKLTLSPL